MQETIYPDLVDWLFEQPRPYEEVMDAWRTSCPRLSIWEDAVDQGLVERRSSTGKPPTVFVPPKGVQFLNEVGRLEIS